MKSRQSPFACLRSAAVAAVALVLLAGCATIYEYLPMPSQGLSLRWLWGGKSPVRCLI